jgi:hypothetical protein
MNPTNIFEGWNPHFLYIFLQSFLYQGVTQRPTGHNQ